MIPALAHFIWYGRQFPWTHEIALRSALLRGAVERVVLHHDAPLPLSGELRTLMRSGRLELRPLSEATFAGLDPRLVALHDSLAQPAARANLVRAAVLAREGGVYLDMDTVTVAALTPLLAAGAFCGEEHLVYPAAGLAAPGALGRSRARALSVLRDACRDAPDGWRLFRRIERLYPVAANNAVLGAEPGHPLMVDLLEAVLRMPESSRRVRYALGTHLLQKVLASTRDPSVCVHAPPAFYPLGPVVSQHWFRPTRRLRLDELLQASTRVVHWYASLRTEAATRQLDAAHVRAHRGHEPFSAMVSARLPELCA